MILVILRITESAFMSKKNAKITESAQNLQIFAKKADTNMCGCITNYRICCCVEKRILKFTESAHNLQNLLLCLKPNSEIYRICSQFTESASV